MKATIIIPTYNEHENVPELVRRIRASVDSDIEILVVDDSPDNRTAQAASKAGCRVIQRTQRKGLSSAVIEGINFVDSSTVIVMDADLQHPPETLPALIKALDTHDFVVASRYIEGGGCREWDLDRKVISRVANLAARPLTNVRDAVSGFFGFRRSGLPEMNKLSGRGFKIMLELLVKGNWNSVIEVPYTFGIRQRGKTKLGTAQIRSYLAQLLELHLYKFRILRFGMVGALGAVIGLGSLYALTEFAGLYYLLSYAIAFVLSVTNNWYWNSRWTFGRTVGASGWTKYATISALTLVLNIALVYTLTDIAGLWYMFSATLGILSAFIINYTLSRRFVWHGHR